jgi:acyl dehydratase
MSDIRKATVAGLSVGSTFVVQRTFVEKEVSRFADMTQDYNPIHFDDRFVATKGLRGRICHGLLVGGMVTEIGGQIGWLASGIHFRFKKPVYFGDEITCTMTITELEPNGRARAEAIFRNQHDEVVLTAQITGRVPVGSDREVLKQMMAEGDPTNGIRE